MPVYKSENKTKDGASYFFKINYKNVNGQYKQKRSKLYKTKSEATNEEAKFRSSIGMNDASSITFNSVFEHYISNKKNEVKVQTIPKIERLYKYIGNHLGETKISKLTVFQYEEFKNQVSSIEYKKGKTLSTKYKNKIHSLVKSLIQFSSKYYSTNNDVPIRIGGFTEPNYVAKEMDFYTFEEYKLFRSSIDELKWLCFFDTLYFCGLRQGEANGLQWKDISFNDKTLSVNKTVTNKVKGHDTLISSPKTKSSIRTLPIPKALLRLFMELKEHYETYVDFNVEWFCFGGIRPLGETTITNKKNNIAAKANIKVIRIHDFRHSCASLLINNGANITIVAKYLGHSQIDMTLNTYSHMYKSKLDEITSLLDELELKT